jgi:hypothetical protein
MLAALESPGRSVMVTDAWFKALIIAMSAVSTAMIAISAFSF